MDFLFSLACVNAFFELLTFLFMLKSLSELFPQPCGTNSTHICPRGILHELTGKHKGDSGLFYTNSSLFTQCVYSAVWISYSPITAM